MKKYALILITSMILMGMILSGCSGSSPVAGENNTDNSSNTDTVPIDIQASQLVANPASYVGKKVSFTSSVTDLGPSYVLFDTIKVTVDSVPAGTEFGISCMIIGTVTGLVGDYIVVSDSLVIPDCDG
ncbi:MAG: hypothetical protein ACRKGH_03860 [Dehalogenimonas sp.]